MENESLKQNAKGLAKLVAILAGGFLLFKGCSTLNKNQIAFEHNRDEALVYLALAECSKKNQSVSNLVSEAGFTPFQLTEMANKTHKGICNYNITKLSEINDDVVEFQYTVFSAGMVSSRTCVRAYSIHGPYKSYFGKSSIKERLGGKQK